jgi:microcystin-dependent protein
MSTPYLSELKIMSFGFPPKGWALCNGQLLPINQNQALFSLLGTTYGGDGRVNFGLPDLRSRVPMHVGNGHALGERGGEEGHTVVIAEMAGHNHVMRAKGAQADINVTGRTPGTGVTPAQSVTGLSTSPIDVNIYSSGSIDGSQTFAAAAIGNTGGSQAHENRQPLLTLSVCIALQGIFPSQN